MKYKILLVEDERELSEAVSVFLKYYGYDVKQAFDGKNARIIFESFEPDIVLMDIMLPDEQGVDLCRFFKMYDDVGVIFTTALSSKEKIVQGFRAGGDDYVTKPFDLDILMLRIEALTNRKKVKKEALEVEIKQEIHFDSYNNKLVSKRSEVILTPTEFKIMFYLNQSNRYISTTELTEALYGRCDRSIPTRTISVHIAKIRKKLLDCDIHWLTVESKYKQGYRLNRD